MTVIENLNTQSFWTKIVLLVSGNVALMAGAALSPGMPAMLAEFSSIPGAAFWVSMIITLPALFVVVGGPITGFLTDRYGRKPVLVVSILLCGVSGSAGYFLNSIAAILVTRALVGFGIAGATTATNSLIADYFEGQQRAKFMGFQSAFTGLGGVVFLPIGGILADINWHYAFLAYLPLFVLFPLALIFIKEPEQVVHQPGTEIETRLIWTPTIYYIFSAIFISHFAFMTMPVYIAYFMTALLGVGGLEIGILGAASGIFSFLGGVLYERIGRKAGFRDIALIGFFTFSLGFLALGFARGWPLVITGQLILGFCIGLNTSNLTNWLADKVSAQMRGRANGIFVTMMFLGQFITSFVCTPIVTAAGYNSAYIVSAVIIVLLGLAGLFLKQDKVVKGVIR